MNRRQLALIITLNALISLAIALGVAWVIEARRPDPEELAIVYPPTIQVITPAAQTENSAANVAAAVTPTPPAATEVPTAPTVAATTDGEQEVYIVQAGDSLGAIADRFGISIAAIMAANELENPDFVFSGQRLLIPTSNTIPTTPDAVTPTSDSPPAQSTGEGLRIVEIAAPGNLLSEAVSVVNDSDIAVNLQGWQLTPGDGPSYTFGDVSIFAGSTLWVHSRTGTNTPIALYWNQSEPVWQSGSVAQLVNPQGQIVTSYTTP
jgi:LysM repeat protein